VLASSSHAKVIDFALAKAFDTTAVMATSASMSPTIIFPAMTQAGIMLATAAYMNPSRLESR
jgi:hypothetical protein